MRLYENYRVSTRSNGSYKKTDGLVASPSPSPSLRHYSYSKLRNITYTVMCNKMHTRVHDEPYCPHVTCIRLAASFSKRYYCNYCTYEQLTYNFFRLSLTVYVCKNDFVFLCPVDVIIVSVLTLEKASQSSDNTNATDSHKIKKFFYNKNKYPFSYGYKPRYPST